MMRSLFSGVSGLKVHQTKMDVIGNNIANVNTTGFKSGRATFNEIFSQTLAGASAPNAATGRAGTNAMQVGLGVSVSSIDNVMTEGAAQRTDRAEDLKIEGDGFFIVGDSSGKYFTRAGAFKLDKEGTLATSSGMKVYGWGVNASGKIETGPVQPIEIMSAKNMYSNPQATKNIAFEGNIFTGDADGFAEDGTTPNESIKRPISFFDSLGNRYTTELVFRYTPDMAATDPNLKNKWTVEIPNATEGPFAGKPVMMMNGETPIELKITGATAGPTGGALLSTLTFNSSGKLVSATNGTATTPGTSVDFSIDSTGLPVGAILESPMSINFGELTQFKEKTSAQAYTKDGLAPGELTKYSIGPDGIITGSYSNGTTKTFGQIALANFKNPAGLEKMGDNLFSTTPNSGEFDGIGQDPTMGGSKLNSGVLEMSNVDLSSEFTEMITTQRGFQANSKIITTSDEMLQELVNLKR